MKSEFSPQIFQTYSNVEFHSNPSGGNRDVPCGRTDAQTDEEELKHHLTIPNCHFLLNT